MGKIWYVTGGVLACLSLGACGTPDAADQVVKDAHAPTIVSLNPCIDAILVEVAQPEQILALSHYSRDPNAASMDVSRAREFGVTGGTAEEIIALKPDIVLASSFIAPATRNALERLGVKVETFGSPKSVEESYGQIRQVANLVKSDKLGDVLGKALILDIEASFAPPPIDLDLYGANEIKNEFSALVWQSGQIVPGEDTVLIELLSRNGFVHHAKQAGLVQGDYVSLERVLSDPPDLLLVAGQSAGQEHPLLQSLVTTRVERLEGNLLYCAGPTISRLNDRLFKLQSSMMDDRLR